MAEPNTAAVGVGICAASPLAASICSAIGVPLDLLAWALFSSIIITYLHPQIDGRLKSFLSIMWASLLAAAVAQGAADWAAKYLEIDLAPGMVKGAAMLIGGFAPFGIPVAVRWINSFGGEKA